MVLDLAQFLLAHGSDPTPLAWDEALANLVKFLVTFLLIGFMSYPVLQPLFTQNDEAQTSKETSNARPNGDTVAWLGIGLLLVLAVGWWLTRASLVEVMTEESSVQPDHAHTQTEGGQIAMWADFHAEVVRVESGELRIYLRDSYNRDIAARFFDVEVQPLQSAETTPAASETPDPKAAKAASETEFLPSQPALNDAYRFVRISRDFKEYRVKVSTPGWSTQLRFNFDGTRGKRSLPIWCAAPNR